MEAEDPQALQDSQRTDVASPARSLAPGSRDGGLDGGAAASPDGSTGRGLPRTAPQSWASTTASGPRRAAEALRSPGMDQTVRGEVVSWWLAEARQQAALTHQQLRDELELMRDVISASSGELCEFKRHSAQASQQLQAQVASLRAELSQLRAAPGLDAVIDAVEQAEPLTKQLARLQHETTRVASGLRAVEAGVEELRRASSAEAVQAASTQQAAEANTEQLRRCLDAGMSSTRARLEQAEQAISTLRAGASSHQEVLAETKQDWRRGQELLGEAIRTLSEDLASVQRSVGTTLSQLEARVDHLAECRRGDLDKLNNGEARLEELRRAVRDAADRGAARAAPWEADQHSPAQALGLLALSTHRSGPASPPPRRAASPSASAGTPPLLGGGQLGGRLKPAGPSPGLAEPPHPQSGRPRTGSPAARAAAASHTQVWADGPSRC